MLNLNKVIIAGNLTKDPELKQTQSGVAVCSFSIGVQRKYKTDGKYESDFINIVAWKQTATFVTTYFTKGKPILIVGSIQTRNYEKDGKKVYVTEVNADEVNFVESKSDTASQPAAGMQTLGPDEIFRSDKGLIMAWIEAHQELANHPKTIRLSSKLHLNKPSTIGSLVLLWWWAIDYAPDGDLSKYEPEIIADVMHYKGKFPEKLIAALKETGFVNEDNTIHDWDEYGGKLITAREESRERAKTRKKAQRERFKNSSVTDKSQECHDDVTAMSRVTKGLSQTEENRTEENRIEENRTEENIKTTVLTDDYFNRFWSAYPKKAAKQDALKAWKKIKPNAELTEQIVSAVQSQSTSEQWKKEGGQFIPNPATWLNRGQWEDEIKAVSVQRVRYITVPEENL